MVGNSLVALLHRNVNPEKSPHVIPLVISTAPCRALSLADNTTITWSPQSETPLVLGRVLPRRSCQELGYIGGNDAQAIGKSLDDAAVTYARIHNVRDGSGLRPRC